jgi:hypothetical protein
MRLIDKMLVRFIAANFVNRRKGRAVSELYDWRQCVYSRELIILVKNISYLRSIRFKKYFKEELYACHS